MDLYTVPFHTDEPIDLRLRGAREIRPPLGDGGPWERMAAIYEPVAETVAVSMETPVVASGDCTTALGVLAGLRHQGTDAAIVWFDAHGDFNTDRTTVSGYLGGMPLAVAVGRGDSTTPMRLGLPPVAEERVLLVGARDLDDAEREALDGSRVRRAGVGDLTMEAIPKGPIYLHVDLDVLDPGELGGLRYPAPGGPRLADLVGVLEGVVRTGQVAGVGLGCTWFPDRVDPDQCRRVVDAVLEVLP